MKVYSIGRDNDCDIVIIDAHNIVSRRHATLNVSPTGKMTITDTSHNGTYVNGILISSNVPFPVSRKDKVSFAHIAQLDWACIPDPLWYVKYVIGGVCAVVLASLVLFLSLRSCESHDQALPEVQQPGVFKNTEDSLKAKENARKDSISNEIERQLRKAGKLSNSVDTKHASDKKLKTEDNVKAEENKNKDVDKKSAESSKSETVERQFR